MLTLIEWGVAGLALLVALGLQERADYLQNGKLIVD